VVRFFSSYLFKFGQRYVCASVSRFYYIFIASCSINPHEHTLKEINITLCHKNAIKSK
jgi:hypothetical protein